ncbi:MAG: ribonuclease III [Candidatus Latescibacterota bacterium]
MKGLSAFLRLLTRRASRKSKSDADLDRLQKRIGHRFRRQDLLIEALKHRSYTYSRGEHGTESNERMEFLGDSVLDLLVTEHLYRTFPEKREGALTEIRSLVVSKRVLAYKAMGLQLGDYLRLNKSEAEAGGRMRTSILGDAYEALLGAMFLDGGLEPVRRFLKSEILDDVEQFASDEAFFNYKSALLEWTQGAGKGHPVYPVKSEEGPDHQKTFILEVTIQGQRYGSGMGKNKKTAEQMAAKETLKMLQVET